MKISIVIPVYNEERQLAACLRTIAAQAVRPFEVIVVDNNSHDKTIDIARSFDFVKVLSAKRQGVVYARDHGFNAARGDIIGRIDADTRLPVDWTLQLQQIFLDQTVAAVSGAMDYHDLPFRKLNGKIDAVIRTQVARRMSDQVFLQGANMAIRRSAWLACRDEVCHVTGLHEDFDLAIHLSLAGQKAVFCPKLKASISGRCLDDSVPDFWRYALLSPWTYAKHNLRSGRIMYVAVGLALLFHLPLRAIYRSQNGLAAYRVNPATYVD